MTKKDYEMIAASLRVEHTMAKYYIDKNTGETYSNALDHLKGVHQLEAIRTVVQSLSSSFEDDNPKFDPNRFMAACGFDENGISQL